jgi:tetratricopeptide (TPR) repeat protein
MPFGFNKSDKDKLSELFARARKFYDQSRVEDAEVTWRQAVAFGELHEDLMGLVVIEAIAFGEKQSLFADFDPAKAKFDQALRIMALDLDCPDVLYAMAYSKSAANETGRGRDEEAMRCFKLAVNHFAKADDLAGLELGYADCQHQFGRTLQRLKNFTAAVDALEKALELYGFCHYRW